MDKLINRYKENLSRKIEVIARANELPNMLDIYDISELYTNDKVAQSTIKGVIVEAYKSGALVADKGLRENKILTTLGRKTEIRNGVMIVLSNDNEIIIHKDNFKKWLVKVGSWPLKDCLLANWWANNDSGETGHGFTVHNPETTQALYEKLIEHGLIKPEGPEKFKEAFEGGIGFISWVGEKDKLGYFVRMLKTNKIITNKSHMKIAANLFITRGVPLTSNNLGSGAELISDSNMKIINKIIDTIAS